MAGSHQEEKDRLVTQAELNSYVEPKRSGGGCPTTPGVARVSKGKTLPPSKQKPKSELILPPCDLFVARCEAKPMLHPEETKGARALRNSRSMPYGKQP